MRVKKSLGAFLARRMMSGVPRQSSSSAAAGDPDSQFGTWREVNPGETVAEGSHAIQVEDPNLETIWGPQEKPEGPEAIPNANDHTHVHLNAMFNMVHARTKKTEKAEKHQHLEEHGFDVPVTLAHLFKRPVVRQWLYKGNLYRETDERIPSRFELFFDLMFVGIAHILADGAAEEASGFNVLKFILEFFPAWIVWMDVRTFLNVSGTDDIKERLGLLGVMILLTGFSANAAAIQITFCDPEAFADEPGYCTEPEKFGNHVQYHDHISGDYWFDENYTRYLHAAIGFYLALRLFRILLRLYYGLILPKFRPAMWVNAFVCLLISGLYLPIMWIDDAVAVTGLMFAGMCAELFDSFIVLVILWIFNGIAFRKGGEALFIPAISQEHAIERTIQFVLVVVGEMIINSTYVARLTEQETYIGVNPMFGRSALAIGCSFMLIWLYYDADSSRTYQHALRRNWLTSHAFSLIHFPLSASLILAGASLAKLIKDPDGEETASYLWYWSGSCFVALLCIATIGILHRNLDKHGSTRLPRSLRLFVRVVMGIIILFLPMMHSSTTDADGKKISEDWNIVEFLGVNFAILTALVTFETFAKLGAVGRRYDDDNAALVRRAKLTTLARIDPAEQQRMREARAHLRSMGVVTYPPLMEGDAEKSDAEREPLRHLRLKRNLSWHPYDGLTLGEQGEEDVGMEGELGRLEMKELSEGQRWAFAT